MSVPVPDKFTVCGLFVALSVMTRVPELTVAEVGAKVTLIVQVSVSARLAGQLLVCENPEGVVMLATVSEPGPSFVNDTGWDALELFANWVPNWRELVESVAVGAIGVNVRLK